MTTQLALADSFRRLTAALAEIEKVDEGQHKADAVRQRLAAHVDAVTEGLRNTGKAKSCQQHPGQLAHNCACCRSERIAAEEA